MNAKARYDIYRRFAGLLAPAGGGQRWQDLSGVMSRVLSAAARTATAAEIKELWRASLPAGGRGARAGRVDLYMAAPYCRKRCSYCMYFSRPLRHPSELSGYINKLCASISYYSDVLDGLVFHAGYFGGGTPSLFTEAQLERLERTFTRHIRFRPDGERTVECNPASLSPGKLRIFRRMGFNRLSLGVQSLDARLLRAMNRAEQTPALVERAIAAGKEYGFRVNVDLLSGLAGDDGSATFSSIMWTAARAPDKITVCRLSPTGHYLASLGGDPSGAGLTETRPGGWLLKAEKECRALGFRHESGGLGNAAETTSLALLRTPPPWKFTYRFSSAGGKRAIFGLGHQASSYIFASLRYSSRELGGDPGGSEYSAFPYSRKDAMRAFILGGFDSRNHLDIGKFRSVFRTHPEKVFSKELAALAALKKIERGKDYLSFLAKDPADRLACAFFLLDQAQLVSAMRKLTADGAALTP